MRQNRNHFEFTGVIFRDGRQFVSLCMELDVASQGKNPREARQMLAEAVGLYLETCFEDGVPYLRPVPQNEDPRSQNPEGVVEVFPLKVDFEVHAVA